LVELHRSNLHGIWAPLIYNLNNDAATLLKHGEATDNLSILAVSGLLKELIFLRMAKIGKSFLGSEGD
jgi:hypothetical protein